MRLACAFAFAFAAVGCGAPEGSPLPVAPASDLTLTTAAGSVTGTTFAEMISSATECPPERGIGLHAATEGVAIDVLFPRWPDEGAVYDLSVPGTSDFVVVSATQGRDRYCVPENGGTGTIVVGHFELVGSRYLANVDVSGVVAGAATLDAHLFH